MGREAGDGRVVTFLMGDLASSTANWLAAPMEMDTALRVHDDVVRGAVEDSGGTVFKHTGDGFLAWFDAPGAAVDAALRIRSGLASVPAELEPYLAVRLAADTGWAIPRGDDWFGPGVNRVARLTDVASEAGVVVSRAVVETAGSLVSGAEPLGSIELRDHAEPIALFGLGGARLVTTKLPSAAGFPATPTSFVGRVAERREIRALLERSRLVSLVAIGGAGKTRLAIDVGRSWVGETGFADLVPCSDERDVVSAIAVGAGVALDGVSGATGAAAIRDHAVEFLGDRERLVVVDNCEHVLAHARRTIEDLVARCPGLRVLLTSREPLGASGEHVYPVPMLDVGVELFRERATGHGVDIGDEPVVEAALRDVCRRLDGLPLAIELAAARLRDLSLRELVDRLDAVMSDAEAAGDDGPERHRTMRDMVTWSHRDLSVEAQDLFERLSLFEGSFAAADVELVDAADPVAVATLVRRSLLVAERSGLDLRYRMLEPVRQVAAGLLDARGTARQARLALIEGLMRSWDTEYGVGWWDLHVLDSTRLMLPTAWALTDWLAEEGEELLLVRFVGRFAGAATVFAGARRVAQVLADRTDVFDDLPLEEHADVLVAYSLAGIGCMQIDHTTAGVTALFGLGLSGGPALSFAHRAAALGAMNEAFRSGEADSPFAVDLLGVARTIAADSGSRYEQAAVEAFLGWAHLLAGRWVDAEATSRQGLRVVEENNVWHMVLTTNLGMALLRLGRPAEALDLVRTHPEYGRYFYMGDLLGVVEVLALADLGEHEAANARLSAAIDRILASTHPGHRSDLVLVSAWVAVRSGRLDDARRLAQTVISTRGPHTMQLMMGLADHVGVAPSRAGDDATEVVERPLIPLLEAERDRLRSIGG